MNNTLQTLRNRLEQAKGRKTHLEDQIALNRKESALKRISLASHEQAREIIRAVGIQTQNQLSYNISDITSLALEAVFDDPYSLRTSFVLRRNKTECDLTFVRDGEEVDPLSACGGGAVDVASFALRIASWTMQRPRTRPVIILDEPLRFLSVDLQERASQMMKTISEKLGIQFLVVSHSSTLASYADKVFEVSIRNGKSIVK
jgi:DNA repair exonuclease SbcCD ATPase subunit